MTDVTGVAPRSAAPHAAAVTAAPCQRSLRPRQPLPERPLQGVASRHHVSKFRIRILRLPCSEDNNILCMWIAASLSTNFILLYWISSLLLEITSSFCGLFKHYWFRIAYTWRMIWIYGVLPLNHLERLIMKSIKSSLCFLQVIILKSHAQSM